MKKSAKIIIIGLSALLVLNIGAKNISNANKNNQQKYALTNIYISDSIDPEIKK
ncbi:hypothetical protein [Clostridium hydrogenum]|uniref:hypothetical protein n=1 Tax=Clostridium hydrogenum TaxID=2855764 RepID=UPI001F16480B|nr:hypothetical protein [Clostridium hydrogenum]